jgi:hypothetical protein
VEKETLFTSIFISTIIYLEKSNNQRPIPLLGRLIEFGSHTSRSARTAFQVQHFALFTLVSLASSLALLGVLSCLCFAELAEAALP